MLFLWLCLWLNRSSDKQRSLLCLESNPARLKECAAHINGLRSEGVIGPDWQAHMSLYYSLYTQLKSLRRDTDHTTASSPLCTRNPSATGLLSNPLHLFVELPIPGWPPVWVGIIADSSLFKDFSCIELWLPDLVFFLFSLVYHFI